MSAMWNLMQSAFGVNMNQLQGMQGGHMMGGVPRVFKQKYHAYAPAYWNAENRERLEAGDKIVLPASALEQLSRMNVSFPILFRITHDSDILPKKSHCSVLEFTAPEGQVYLPLWMIDNLGLDPSGESTVQLEHVLLPKGNFVQFQAHETAFAMLSNPKAILEKTLRAYSAFTVGDTIQVEFMDKIYKLDVTDVEPKQGNPEIPDAVTIIETDIKVDFKEPRDYKEWEKQQQAQRAQNVSALNANESKHDEEEEEDDDWIIDPAKAVKQSKSFHFGSSTGGGYKVGSGAKTKPASSASSSSQGNVLGSAASSSQQPQQSPQRSYDSSMAKPSSRRGVPLGMKAKAYKDAPSPPSEIFRQSSSPQKRKVEEIVGNMRYIYEVDEAGNRTCVRKLPLRKVLWDDSKGHSLKQ